MCTYLTEKVLLDGAGKGAAGLPVAAPGAT